MVGAPQYYEDGEIATWRDVFYYFIDQMKNRRGIAVLAHLTLFSVLSYIFFVGVVLFGISTQILGGCDASLLMGGNNSNPITAVMAGVLSTCLFQSTTVSNLLIGSLAMISAIDVKTALYLTMGANVGNSVTSSLVAVSHLGDKSLLERAVAGSSVNTIYYFLTIMLFLPLEMASGALLRLGIAITPATRNLNYQWGGLVGLVVYPVTDFLIIPNQVRLCVRMRDGAFNFYIAN